MSKRSDAIDDAVFAALAEVDALPEEEQAPAFLKVVAGAQKLLAGAPLPRPRPAYPVTPQERERARKEPAVALARQAALRAGVKDEEMDE